MARNSRDADRLYKNSIIVNIKKILRDKKYLDSITIILSKYYKFLNIFFYKKANKLLLR